MLSMPEYLAVKAVSAGVLKTLLDECPAAAWFASPWNPNRPPSPPTDASDSGEIIHSILLQSGMASVQVFNPEEFPNQKGGGTATGWSNKAIREARDAARAAGMIPVLADQYAEIQGAVQAAHNYIASLAKSEPAVFAAFRPDGGDSELTIEREIDGIPCKIRPDRLSKDQSLVIDVKSTKGSAEPDAWGRSQMIGAGYYLSAAFYQRVLATIEQEMPAYVFLVVGQEPPHLCSLVAPDPSLLDLGHRKINEAIRMWGECVRRNQWPSYPPRVAYISAPPWEIMRWEEREVMNIELGSQG